METRWQFGRRSQREEWSRRVGERRPAVFRNPVVLVYGHTRGCTDHLGRLSSVTGTEVMWAAQPKILTVSGPYGKKFASSSLREIRAGFRFHLSLGKEKERTECGPDSVTVASYSLSFFFSLWFHGPQSLPCPACSLTWVPSLLKFKLPSQVRVLV